VFVPLDPFTVNLADRDAERYAQIGVTLEIEDAKVGDQIKAYMPAIRNNILMAMPTAPRRPDGPRRQGQAGRTHHARDLARAGHMTSRKNPTKKPPPIPKRPHPPRRRKKKKKARRRTLPVKPCTSRTSSSSDPRPGLPSQADRRDEPADPVARRSRCTAARHHRREPEARAGRRPGTGMREYDLASQERIVRGRMPTMEVINERFARNIRIGLFNLIRKSPK
jgi:hypothetical protein